MANERERCFVIMPFSKTKDEHTRDYWTKHFNTFLKPLVEENPELEAHRSQQLRGDIIRQIITDLVVCRVVVADLTDQNPNVYWELGVRQSFKHGTVTIAEAGTPLPFDIGGKGTLFYHPKDHLEMEDFRRDFKEAVQDCLTNPDRPDSHVLETLSGRGTLFEIFRRDEAMRRLDAVLAEWKENSEVLARVRSTLKANKRKLEKFSFVTRRFGSAAVQLLATERYVDEEDSFFQLANRCVGWAIALNNQLNCWSSEREVTEAWLSKTIKNVAEVIKTLEGEVRRVRDALDKKL